MPFLNEEEGAPRIVMPKGFRAPIKKDPDPSSWSVIAAAFRQESDVITPITYFTRGGPVNARTNFNYDSVIGLKGTKYEPYIENFFDADTDEEVQMIKNRIDKEEEDRRLVAEGGAIGIAASIAAGVLSPINLIPVGGLLVKGSAAVKAAKGARQTAKALASYGAKVGAVSGATEAVSEGVKQQFQEIRPIEESIFNIGAATLIGGVLGGTLEGVSKSLIKKVEKDLTIDDAVDAAVTPQEKSLSAAAAPQETLSDYDVAYPVARAAVRAFSWLGPTYRLANSVSLTARRLNTELQRFPWLLKKNLEGKATGESVESMFEIYQGNAGIAIKGMKNNYLTYLDRVKGSEERIFSYNEFDELVSLAMTRGDTSAIPEVQKAAEELRKRVYAPLLRDGQTAGVFPENVSPRNAKSYFPTKWDRNKVRANYKSLKNVIKSYLPKALEADLKKAKAVKDRAFKIKLKMNEQTVGSKKYNMLEKKLARVEEELDQYRIIEGRLADQDYDDIADEIIGHILGQKDGIVLRTSAALTKGPAKLKKLDFIPQAVLAPWLDTSAERVTKSYVRDIGPEILLRKQYGDVDLKEQVKAIKEEYTALKNKANSQQELVKLDKQMNSDLNDIKHFIDLLRGTLEESSEADKAIAKFLWTTRALATVSRFGGMLRASIPDLAKMVLVNGLKPIMTDGLVGLIKNMKALKMSAAEAKRAGVAFEVALGNSRALTMNEINNLPYFSDKINTGLSYVQDKFSKISLIGRFDDARRVATSVFAQNRFFTDIDKLLKGKLKTTGVADLASVGIDPNMARRIKKMQDEGFVTFENGIYIANTERWTDRGAASTYLAALNKTVNNNANWLGIGDRPRLMRGSWGKTMMHGTSFAFAATSKTLISGLQHMDAKMVQYVVTVVSLGIISSIIDDIAKGEEIPDDPMVLLARGVDASGIFGILHTVNDRINFATGNQIRFGKLFGVTDDEYRMDPYKAFEGFFGPSGGYVTDVIKPLSNFVNNDPWRERDTRAVRRLIPFQNLIFFRKLFDLAEEGINNALGVKK